MVYTGAIANVVSLAKVKRHYRVKYDGEADDGYFMVYQKSGVKRLTKSSDWYFYYEMEEKEGCLFVTTVRNRREN